MEKERAATWLFLDEVRSLESGAIILEAGEAGGLLLINTGFLT